MNSTQNEEIWKAKGYMGGGGKETEMKEEGYDWRNSTRTANDRSE